MKILITGSNGLLGQKLLHKLRKDSSVQLIATSKGENRVSRIEGYTYFDLDITNNYAVAKLISREKPQVVINTAAMTNVDLCEDENKDCNALNVEAVRYLADACAKIDALLIQISTDFIFDGEDGPYKELDKLKVFEKRKGIKLERVGEYKNLQNNEVAFSADANALSDIEKIIYEFEGIELVSHDETPSISIEHSYFNNNPIFSGNKIVVSSKKGFLINSVSKILLILTNGIEDYSPQDLLKFIAFKNRLFYRVLIIFSSLKWSNNEIVMWDNRRVLHRGTEFDERSARRIMHRTTISGDKPSYQEEINL